MRAVIGIAEEAEARENEERMREGGEIFWLRERELQREVFHGFLTKILRRLKLNRTLPEKGTLRYECNRYIV